MPASRCAHAAEAAAFLSGELSVREESAFQRHLATCAICQAEVAETRQLLDRLAVLPARRVEADLMPGIAARLHEESVMARRGLWWRRVGAAAAMVTLFAGWMTFRTATPLPEESAMRFSPSENAVSSARALEWFCQNQEADGSWSAEKWGGNPRFGTALTALPLIALLEGERTPACDQAILRATAHLRQQQRADGTFSEAFREAPYIQGVSTLALLLAYERDPEPKLRQAVDSALKVIFATQTKEGGWGNLHSPVANLPVTLWHKEVVEAAAAGGWAEAHACLVRANQWLESRWHEEPPVETAFNGHATDFHRAYFAVVSLRQQKTAQAERQLALIRHHLVLHQTATGRESGSWDPADPWGREGGRIYATAMASLALL